MSGRGRSSGRGGRGNSSHGGRGRGRGQNYAGAAIALKRGLCTTLGTNVFDYGQKSAADQMRTSWEKLVQYVGTNYGQDISNELQNKITVTIDEPEHTTEVLRRHGVREQMIRTGQANIQQARTAQQAILQRAVTANVDLDAPMKLAVLQNEIAQGEFTANMDVPVELTDSEKTQYSNEWRTYRERKANMTKHRGQAFSLIQGQCTQLLQDKMKQDTDWSAVSTSYDPLTLYRLIEKTVLAQTEDQYPFATVYEQELGFYSFKQDALSNPQWYERFNTKVDVGYAIGVTRQHKVLLEYVAQELHTQAFADLDTVEQQAVRDDAEERYVSYAFLRQSGTQHGNLKVDLQNEFTTGDNRYPKNRQQTLHLLDKYSKTVVAKSTPSEGASFAQGGGRGGGRGRGRGSGRGSGRGDKDHLHDKEYWKDKECYKCGKLGHPAPLCPDKEDDDKSLKSTASSVSKLKTDFKKMKKAFAQLKENDSDDSDSDLEEETSHFQMDAFQFTQFDKKFDKKFEPRIARLFKQAHGGTTLELDLTEVILLDSQSTMDIFCNQAMVGETSKSVSSMRLKSNGGSMVVTHKAKMPGYHRPVWFSKKAIANILALRNLIQQYHVTYDSDDLIFVVHREFKNKPDMEFRMHRSGLHYYDVYIR
jgi:ribosomal protein L15